MVVDDRFFVGQIDGEGEPGREGQEKLVDLELECIDAAQHPCIPTQELFFQRLVIQPDLKLVPRGELVEILADALCGVDGVR